MLESCDRDRGGRWGDSKAFPGSAGVGEAARGCSLAHPHTGLGPAGQVTGDSIPAPLRLLMGKACFSQRKDRNRWSSGELGANQKNSENLFSSGADPRLPALGQPPAGAGGQGAEPLPARLTADVPRRGRAARRAFIWCPALPRVCGFVNCWVSGIPLRREASPPREQLMRRLGRTARGRGVPSTQRELHFFAALTSQNAVDTK